MDPIQLLDQPLEDVFDLANGLMDYQSQEQKETTPDGREIILRPADDSWF